MGIITGGDVAEECGGDQLCSGVKGGIEGAIHGISKSFDEQSHNGWGLLLSDADNAFNSASRPVFLWAARVLWSRCARFLFNSYNGYPVLVIRGAKEYLFSKEGCTQGSGLAMQAYAIGNLPLIRSLKNPSKWIQAWFADDGACLADFKNLKDWLAILSTEGPRYGYFNQVSKNILIVAPQFVEEAKTEFESMGVKVLTGHKYLGGFVGDEKDKKEWVQTKVEFWVKSIHRISDLAKKDPHCAFTAVSKSLQNEWKYIQRVVEGIEDSFFSLRSAIRLHFLPEICGFEISEFDADLMMRPSRFCGIGIQDPVKAAGISFQCSQQASELLQHAIISGVPLDIFAHTEHCKSISCSFKKN